MKIFLLVLLFLCITSSVSAQISTSALSTSTYRCDTLSRELRLGARDNGTSTQIAQLQRFIAQQGSTTTGTQQPITGYFGALTQKNLLQLCGPAATSSQPASLSGTIDHSPITSLQSNPTLTGTISSSTGFLSVVISTTTTRGTRELYRNDAVSPVGGVWQAAVFPPLSNGVYTLTLSSGTSIVATTTLTIGLRSLPTVALDESLPSSDVSDGHLIRFTVRAPSSGPIGIGQFTFAEIATNADVSAAQLFAYSDPNYTEPIPDTTNGVLNASTTDPMDGVPFSIIPDAVLEVPAGATYYFDLDAAVVPSDTSYTVETTLLGDVPHGIDTALNLASTSNNFIWSPNTHSFSELADSDWLNASLAAGLPLAGISEVRTNAPPIPTPGCSVGASTSTVSSGQQVTITWSGDAAQSAVWEDGSSIPLQGTKVVTVASTHTYIVGFYGSYGNATCFTTVVVPTPVATSTVTSGGTATTTATTTQDSFTATPTTGTVSLAVNFNGSVNTAKACTATTYTFSYGDGATAQIVVAKNLCKAQTFTLNHTYTKVNTYSAALYKGAFSGFATGTAQLLQKQTITVKSKVAFGTDPASQVAGVIFSFAGQLSDWLVHLFIRN